MSLVRLARLEFISPLGQNWDPVACCQAAHLHLAPPRARPDDSLDRLLVEPLADQVDVSTVGRPHNRIELAYGQLRFRGVVGLD